MENSSSCIKEYFLGTDSVTYYREQRDFARKFITDKDDLGEFLKSLKLREFNYLIFDKIIPNIADFGIITGSILTGNLGYLSYVPIVESLRIYGICGESNFRMRFDILKISAKLSHLISGRTSNLSGKLEDIT